MSARQDWMLALAASALREAGCSRTPALWISPCRKRDDYPMANWCRPCRTLERLERMGFMEPERPSDREWREAAMRGELYDEAGGVWMIEAGDSA